MLLKYSYIYTVFIVAGVICQVLRSYHSNSLGYLSAFVTIPQIPSIMIKGNLEKKQPFILQAGQNISTQWIPDAQPAYHFVYLSGIRLFLGFMGFLIIRYY